MKKVIVIAGATATGKSALGLRLAHALDTEIISGDSVQVYRDLNIGSAKLSFSQMEGILHHCIDTRDLDQRYSVYDFQQEARQAISSLHDEGKIPILVGGTGLYLKAALYDYDFSQEENEIPVSEESNEALYNQLKDMDPQAAETIHPNNRKRVLRALEIAKSGMTKSQREAGQAKKPIYDVKMIVLDMPKEILDERIDIRVRQMIEDGLEDEVRRCFEYPKTWEYQSFQGIGYKEWKEYLENKRSLEETIQEIVIHTRQFAKRQKTWFRHQFEADWVDALDPKALDNIVADLVSWAKTEEQK